MLDPGVLSSRRRFVDRQGSYPHTPQSPTPSSLGIWERASEALLNDDSVIGYETRGMEEFAGNLMSEKGIRGWMRGWVEGRTLVSDSVLLLPQGHSPPYATRFQVKFGSLG